MALITTGFAGRRRDARPDLPPGQYLERGFPVLSAGPTPIVTTEQWEFSVADERGNVTAWDWDALLALPAESPTVDLHCVTKWSKLTTSWTGIPLDHFLADSESAGDFALVHSYGGYTTNLPLEDLLDGKAWIVYEYEGEAIAAEHGGPARLLVPHLYLWKSAKWVRRIELTLQDEPGFWESLGYHNYGDPWLEQRYDGD